MTSTHSRFDSYRLQVSPLSTKNLWPDCTLISKRINWSKSKWRTEGKSWHLWNSVTSKTKHNGNRLKIEYIRAISLFSCYKTVVIFPLYFDSPSQKRKHNMEDQWCFEIMIADYFGSRIVHTERVDLYLNWGNDAINPILTAISVLEENLQWMKRSICKINFC